MALVGIQLAIILLIGRNWAYVTTYRLYLERRIDPNEHSAAAQSFNVEGRQVVPRIVTRGPDRLAFKTDIRQDSTIHALLRAHRPTPYAIEWRDGGAHRVLASGTVSGTASIVCPFPTGTGISPSSATMVSSGSILVWSGIIRSADISLRSAHCSSRRTC
jgi:hypothetical protein